MDENTKIWTQFGKGHWTKTPPTQKGRFPIADRDGYYAGMAILYNSSDGKLYTALPGSENKNPCDAWLGWWWSESMPDLPKPEKW